MMRIAAYDATAKKRPTNVSLNEDLLAKAKEMGINISAAAEDGLAKRVQQEYERQMKSRIDRAMDWRNSYYRDDGHPADEFGEL
ncbi:type II toxin-antitoxin system CcdA family antitoxin [Azospirillum sp. RWY-5-1]|nr:type II toxin-antitoxin system CcdA family antitoxin [Azospirillum oleiclasticum]